MKKVWILPLLLLIIACMNPSSGGDNIETIWWEEDSDGFVQFCTNDSGYLNRSMGTWSENYLSVLDTCEIDTYKVSGNRWGGFGMMFCVQDFDNFYGLLIDIEGYFMIFKIEYGSFRMISDWTFSPLLNLGYNSINRLTVQFHHENSTYDVSFNGIPETTFQDETFHGGYYGYFLDILSSEYENFPAEPLDIRFKAVRETEIQGLWIGEYRIDD